jgi:hypothetical protein
MRRASALGLLVASLSTAYSVPDEPSPEPGGHGVAAGKSSKTLSPGKFTLALGDSYVFGLLVKQRVAALQAETTAQVAAEQQRLDEVQKQLQDELKRLTPGSRDFLRFPLRVTPAVDSLLIGH